MCVAAPGKIVSVHDASGDQVVGSVGTVDFQGSQLEVSLALVPEASAGDWVLVHAGFALQVLDEAQARETWDYIEQLGLES